MFRAPCHILSLDIVDVTGVHVVDVSGKLFKHRLDKNGQMIGFHDAVRFLYYKGLNRWKVHISL
jgi:hypothetical protein